LLACLLACLLGCVRACLLVLLSPLLFSCVDYRSFVRFVRSFGLQHLLFGAKATRVSRLAALIALLFHARLSTRGRVVSSRISTPATAATTSTTSNETHDELDLLVTTPRGSALAFSRHEPSLIGLVGWACCVRHRLDRGLLQMHACKQDAKSSTTMTTIRVRLPHNFLFEFLICRA